MTHKGFSHIGLSTLDLDKTRDFYQNILGFKPVRCDIIKIKEGGRIRHIFFETGRDQLISFMEARGIWREPFRLRPPRRHVRGQNPERSKTLRPSHRATDEV